MSERFSMLLLLTAAVLGNADTSALANAKPTTDFSGTLTNPAATDVLESLRVSVQERLSAAKLIPTDEDAATKFKERLSQFFNFPNFGNAYCFRGYWRNC